MAKDLKNSFKTNAGGQWNKNFKFCSFSYVFIVLFVWCLSVSGRLDQTAHISVIFGRSLPLSSEIKTDIVTSSTSSEHCLKPEVMSGSVFKSHFHVENYLENSTCKIQRLAVFLLITNIFVYSGWTSLHQHHQYLEPLLNLVDVLSSDCAQMKKL